MFAFIESFFLLSLGITFIMIFLMVFHFKQRIEKLERKNNDLSDLSNKIIKEVTHLHSIYLQSTSTTSNQTNNFKQPNEHICENIRISTSIPIPISFTTKKMEEKELYDEPTYKKIIVMDNITNDDINVDDLSDDISTSSYEDDYDNESDMEVENFEISDNIDTQQIHYIKLNKDVEVEVKEIEIEEVEVFDKKETEKVEKKEVEQTQINYNKMTVSNLKILAISKGLCSDTSKIKRADLVKLLEESEHV